LARIRSALTVPAPRRSTGQAQTPIFAPIPDLLGRFQRECLANRTEWVLTANQAESSAAVCNLLLSLPPGEVFAQDAPRLRQMAVAWQGGRYIRWSTEGGPRESSQATITLAEALVAGSGSVLVSSACGGRGASVVAPVHIVVANVDQLVPEIEGAFARYRDRDANLKTSYLCLITGSSRTADIEKILVMGAHGPRRLVVVLSQAR
jgi:L-lactate utilization protein LutC